MPPQIEALLDEDDTRGPFFMRLAWHASGTFAAADKTGAGAGAGARAGRGGRPCRDVVQCACGVRVCGVRRGGDESRAGCGRQDVLYLVLLALCVARAAASPDARGRAGGSNGATMRFAPESACGANAGLDKARALLDPIHAKFPGMSVADLWQVCLGQCDVM